MQRLRPRQLYHAIALLSVAFSPASLWAAPSNDHFLDRIALTGDPVEITGTLYGATLEPNERMLWRQDSSVWYSWRAPARGVALVQSHTTIFPAGITVSTGTTLIDAQQTTATVAELQLRFDRYATFLVEPNVEYQICVSGPGASGGFQMHLGLTNLPVILEQPRSQTVSPGGCAFFTVATAAFSNQLSVIQWQFNGEDLRGRTGPILALTNVSSGNAGNYQAVVTGALGPGWNEESNSRTSIVAELIVKEPAPPVLSVRRDVDGIFMDVQGDIGRSYFLHGLRGLNTNGISVYAASSDAFPIRLWNDPFNSAIGEVRYVEVWNPPNAICNLNLKRIFFGKNRVAADQNLEIGDAFKTADLDRYIFEDLACPDGGEYTHSSIGTYPICSVIGHLLEQQPRQE
jgi:hypothetical protein